MSRQTSQGFKSFDKETLLGILEVGVQKVHVGMNPPFGSNPRVVNDNKTSFEMLQSSKIFGEFYFSFREDHSFSNPIKKRNDIGIERIL